MIDESSFPLTATLVRCVPEFKSQVEEHIQSNDGLLEHVLVGELFVFAEQTYATMTTEPKTADRSADTLKRIFEFVERCAASDDERLNNPIVVSFLNLLRPDTPGIEAKNAELRNILRNTRVVGKERSHTAVPNPAFKYFRSLLGPRTLAEWQSYTGYE